MKNTLKIIAVLVLTAALLCGCTTPSSTATPSVSATQNATEQATQNATEQVTEQVTQSVTEQVTEGVTEQGTLTPTVTTNFTDAPTSTAPVTQTPTVTPSTAKDVMIEGFESGTASSLVAVKDLSDYDIVSPAISITSSGTDSGKGFLVTLPDSTAWCQSLTLSGSKVTTAFKDQKVYLRMWVNNSTSGSLGIGISLNGVGTACYGVSKAKLTAANGTSYTFTGTDPSGMGMGTPSAIVVPSEFQGWIAFNATDLIKNWGNDIMADTATVTSFTLDIRPSGFMGGDSYVIDDICFSNNPYGATRSWTDPNTTDKSQLILSGFNNAIKTTPTFHEMSSFNPTGQFSGIKAGWFEGMDRNGKKTKVFAYVGYPSGASASNKVPAIVLDHGGGGHAYLQWVKMWNDRGYAAIAIDNTGYFPTKVNAGSTETNGDWAYGLPASLQESGYVDAPNNDGMGSSSGKVSNMWMYHAVGQTILASNILRADSRVDSSKIGITGVSWGGVITSITIGYDSRFAFAIPIYGSGYLDEALSWMKNNFAGADTKKLWLAQDNFNKVKMPVLWLCWNDDNCFSINSNSKSYLDTVKNNPDTRLSMINLMYHSHGCGWAPVESMTFADSVTKNTFKLSSFNTLPTTRNINVGITPSAGATEVSAKVYYITEKMSYSNYDKFNYGRTDSSTTFMTQQWQTMDLTVSNNVITGTVPSSAKGFYIELRTKVGNTYYVTCTPYTTVD